MVGILLAFYASPPPPYYENVGTILKNRPTYWNTI